MGIQFSERNPKMNKLFLVCLAFAMTAVAYGQPTEEFNLKALAKLPKEQRQCAANKFMINKLAGLNSKDVAQPKDCGSDIVGCIASLAGTMQVVPSQLFNGNWLLLVLLLLSVLEIHAMTASVKLLNGLAAVMFVKQCKFEIYFEKIKK